MTLSRVNETYDQVTCGQCGSCIATYYVNHKTNNAWFLDGGKHFIHRPIGIDPSNNLLGPRWWQLKYFHVHPLVGEKNAPL